MMTTGEAIDPAGGTGDLLLYYNGPKTIWDIDENALKLCKFNYELNKQTNYILSCKNSLDNFVDHVDRYSYSTMNPPFGSNTIVTDKSILDKFELGKGKKKQEIGILFLELGLKLLKHNGILFVIVPAGYLGNSNKNCSELRELILKNRLIASVSLPENTFKRSGTGVNTYLLIIQKKSVSLGSYNVEPYNIYIKDINNIGYNLTKKDTPLKYKIVKETGDYELDNDNKQLLDNDLEKTATELSTFCLDNNIAELSHTNNIMSYESVSTSKLTLNILDVKRYLQTYITILHELTANSAVKVKSLCKIVSTTTKINKTSQYKYIDISEINSPLYSYKDLYGWELPSRAKYTLKKHDILISKLEGTMSYCVILEDDPNYIATNGVCVLRPNNMNCLYILISNIMTKKFVIQHNAFLTGSIMASVSDTDIEEIWIDEKNVDIASTKKILDTLELLQQLRK
jgi:type I restriction-modification system DNA methylase subunit